MQLIRPRNVTRLIEMNFRFYGRSELAVRRGKGGKSG